MTIRSYLKIKKIENVKIDVDVVMESEKHENKRKSTFRRNIRISGTHDEVLKKRILLVAEKCPVHAVLKGEIEIISEIED
jgi:putative redox protein